MAWSIRNLSLCIRGIEMLRPGSTWSTIDGYPGVVEFAHFKLWLIMPNPDLDKDAAIIACMNKDMYYIIIDGSEAGLCISRGVSMMNNRNILVSLYYTLLHMGIPIHVSLTHVPVRDYVFASMWLAEKMTNACRLFTQAKLPLVSPNDKLVSDSAKKALCDVLTSKYNGYAPKKGQVPGGICFVFPGTWNKGDKIMVVGGFQ
jgi:hypothetical protein